jgi:hypothetical protein
LLSGLDEKRLGVGITIFAIAVVSLIYYLVIRYSFARCAKLAVGKKA